VQGSHPSDQDRGEYAGSRGRCTSGCRNTPMANDPIDWQALGAALALSSTIVGVVTGSERGWIKCDFCVILHS
jgi:hypothetical protein